MEKIQEVLKRLSQNTTRQDSNTKAEYECELCQDNEFIWNIETNTATPCQCREVKRCKRILEDSGISEAFKTKTVNEFKPKNDVQADAKKMAVEYITNFETIRKEKNNSVVLVGQVGSGKTHLTIAIANALLKAGIPVLYMQYREVMTQVKQFITDSEAYQSALNRYKTVQVLLIDDLYKSVTRKGEANESEISIMFEIINYRYLTNLPVLVSSEYTIDEMIDFDEATGSRIGQMCKGRYINFVGAELNHRMI